MNVRTHYPPWATITGLLRGMWIIFKYSINRLLHTTTYNRICRAGSVKSCWTY